MRSRRFGKVAAIMLALLMVIVFIPSTAFAGSSESGGTGDSITVYFTICNDGGDFITGNDSKSTVLARVPVKISYTDLAQYGLERFNRYEADSFENGGKYKNEVIVKQPTLLMLYMKVLGTYYLNRDFQQSDVGTEAFNPSGSATSMFMNEFWGHEYNLNYYVNHAYPLMAKGWGSTADYILLEEGDEIDVNMFASWDGDETFYNFTTTHKTVNVGDSVDMKLQYATPDYVNYTTGYEPLTDAGVRVSSDYGRTWKSDVYKTDSNGEFTAKFDKPGIFYLSNSEVGDGLGPAISVIKVKPGKAAGTKAVLKSNTEAEYSWNAVDGADGYKVSYKKSTDSKWTTKETNKTSFNVDGLDPGATYQFKVLAYVNDDYVAAEEKSTTLDGEYGDISTVETLAQPTVKLEAAGTDAVKATWQKVSGADNYTVYYQAKGDKDWKSMDTAETTLKIDGLKSNTEYNVKVAANKKLAESKIISAEGTASTAKTDIRYFGINTEIVNGIIDTDTKVAEEGNITVNYSPADGYKVAQVLVDGKIVIGSDGSIFEKSYTFTNVTEAHSIKIICEKLPAAANNTGSTGNSNKVTDIVKNGKTGTKGVNTGDDSELLYVLSILMAAAGTMTVMILHRKKNEC